MKHAITFVLGLIVVFAVGGLLWPTLGSAQAQAGCKSIHLIGQATLPSSTPLGLTFDVWGGPVYGILGSVFPFRGVVSGNDGQDSCPGPGGDCSTSHAANGQGRGGSYTVGTDCVPVAGSPFLSCASTFTYEVPHAVFTMPPGGGFMGYIGNTAKIVGGTGKYTGASGTLNVRGPAFAWPDTSAFGASGRWNPEITGNICGVQ